MCIEIRMPGQRYIFQVFFKSRIIVHVFVAGTSSYMYHSSIDISFFFNIYMLLNVYNWKFVSM